MKYDTRKITNLSDKVFNGKYNGVDFVLEPKEERYLPAEVSEHLAKQLALLLKCEQDEVLGELIETKDIKANLSFKQEIEQFENEFKEWQEEQRKNNLLKKQEALKNV